MVLAASVRISARVSFAVVIAVSVVSCGRGEPAPFVTVGAGNSAQADVIAEIYAGALARTGAAVTTRTHLGQRRDYLIALDAGTVTLVGEDSGDLLTALDSASVARTPKQVTAAVNRALPEGLVVSDPAEGTDLRPAVVRTGQQEDRYPATLQELAPHCATLTVGIAIGPGTDPLRLPLDPQRDVVIPLREVYGCAITRYTAFASDTELRKAVLDGVVQAGVLTAPPSFLPGGNTDLVVLADTAEAFRARNIVPVFRKGTLTDRQIRRLNDVAGELTTADLADLVRRLRDDHASAVDLARNWLDAHLR